jgi:predicted RNA methylase
MLATQFYEYEKTTQDASAEIAFYDAYAHSACGPILEPMCGSGRILLPLLQRGYDIEGFDASEAMLAVLRQKYAMITSAPAPVWNQYMQDFVAQKKYALIIIPFGSFGLVLERADALAALRALKIALLPQGKLVVEIDTVYSVDSSQLGSRMHMRRCDDGSALRLKAQISYNQQLQIYESRCLYERLQNSVVVESEYETFEQYVYGAQEFDQLLVDAGFTSIQKYVSYTSSFDAVDVAPHVIYESTF